MIKLFTSTDKYFSSNGDKIIKPLKAKIHKEDNGAFYLDLETDLKYIDYLVTDNIIVANTPQGEQAFRISNTQITKHKIILKAKHVFYDGQRYLIEDSYVVDKNCNDALDHLNSATDNESPFTTLSDIETINSFRCVRKSLCEAVETVIERWGGHLVRDNFNIEIRKTIGKDNNVVIRYKKNLQEITCEENWDNVVTKILPVGKDGLLLPELYIESTLQYSLPYTKTVSFTQDDIEEGDYTDDMGAVDTEAYTEALIANLRHQAEDYVNTYSAPQVNYTLKANINKITDIGDMIEVIDERLGLNITTNVIAYDYDCIAEKYTSIEFGNFKNKLQGFASAMENKINEANEKTETVKVSLGEELQQATDKIWSALGNSYVIYEGDKILVVDTLPKEEATNVIMINNGGIGFSQTGINGTFNSAWTIDGTLNMQHINVINLVADMIKGGTLKLGSKDNQSGRLELYDEANNLIGEMSKDGLKMYGLDGSYVLMNNEVGFAGYDRNDNKIYWVSKDEFHMKKSVVEEEITLCNQLRFIPIQITDDSGNVVNEGIGLVSAYTGGDE